MAKLEKLIKQFGRKCYYCPCETRLPMEKGSIFDMATRDHVVALSNGGKNTADNIVIACYTCNCLKGSMTEEEYRNSPYLKKRIDELENNRNRFKSIKQMKMSIVGRTARAEKHRARYAEILSKKKGIPPEEILAEWDARESAKR